MRYGTCNACRLGDHENHERSVVRAPPGMMGGVVCNCKGECRDVPPEQRVRDLLGGGYGVRAAGFFGSVRGSVR